MTASTSSDENQDDLLQVECRAVRALLAKAARDDVTTRYQVGVHVNKVRKDARYGKHGVDTLAAEVAVPRATLYRYAFVAENWTETEMNELSRRANTRGEPLCWKHMTALTRVTDTARRWQIVDRCLLACWSARELEERIAADEARHARHPTPGADDDIEERESSRVALREVAQNASRYRIALQISAEALEARVAEEDPDEQLVESAIHALEKLRGVMDASLDQLRAALRSSGIRVAVEGSRPAGIVEDGVDDDEEKRALFPRRPVTSVSVEGNGRRGPGAVDR